MLAITALYAVRWLLPHTVPPATLDAIRFRLANEYAPPGTVNLSDRAALAASAKLRGQVKLERISAKGLVWGKYVRVEVSIAGATPPDGRRVRYFNLDATGMFTAKHDGLDYYANLW